MHSPQLLEQHEKTGIVVFIHGYFGSPRQFDKLMSVVYEEGYSGLSLLLPGHGSTTKEFSNGTMEGWQNHVDEEVERLSKSYDRIILAGHSMGCLLAINAAVMYKEHVCGLFLLYCPLKVSYFNIASIKVRLKQLFYKKTHPVKVAYHNFRSVPLSPDLLWRNVKPAIELRKLISVTKNELHNIRVPITAVFSESDEIVSMNSLKMLEMGATNTSVKSVVITDSLHAYHPEHEQVLIGNALRELLCTP